jgi:sensor histidine kinase regulating citrate/malate metabolism
MALAATVITQRQYAAMMAQVSDYGASLARFIAAQNAAAALGEDWETVDVAVAEIMKTRNFERITVVDRGGSVQAASQGALVGQPYQPPPGSEGLGTVDGAAATRYAAGGEPVLGFEVPVLFQNVQVGRVALGIPEAPVTRIARLSITLMIVLAVVTVLAVAIAMYFVANWFAKPIRTVVRPWRRSPRAASTTALPNTARTIRRVVRRFFGMAHALRQRSHGRAIDAPCRPATPSRVEFA